MPLPKCGRGGGGGRSSPWALWVPEHSSETRAPNPESAWEQLAQSLFLSTQMQKHLPLLPWSDAVSVWGHHKKGILYCASG